MQLQLIVIKIKELYELLLYAKHFKMLLLKLVIKTQQNKFDL